MLFIMQNFISTVLKTPKNVERKIFNFNFRTIFITKTKNLPLYKPTLLY